MFTFELLWVWCEVKHDAIMSSLKSQAKDEEDDEDHKGEDGSEVDDLSRALYSLDQGQAHNGPTGNEA